jgi:hypothetical protein
MNGKLKFFEIAVSKYIQVDKIADLSMHWKKFVVSSSLHDFRPIEVSFRSVEHECHFAY